MALAVDSLYNGLSNIGFSGSVFQINQWSLDEDDYHVWNVRPIP